MTKTVMDLLVWKNFLVTTGGTQVSTWGVGGGRGLSGSSRKACVGRDREHADFCLFCQVQSGRPSR